MRGQSSNYPPELRERAVRMVAEMRPDYPSDWPTVAAVAAKLGIGTVETRRKWRAGLRSMPGSCGCQKSVTSHG